MSSSQAYLLTKHCEEETHKDRMLAWIFLTEGTDSLNHHNLDEIGELNKNHEQLELSPSAIPSHKMKHDEGLTQIIFHALNSSEISDMNEEICFMRRSMLLSLPVFSRVVMAKVAMLRLESVTRFSKSRLQAVTADGCFMAT